MSNTNPQPLPDCLVHITGTPAAASVIWLHGLGADGHDFEPVIPWLGLPADCNIRFVFPHAPQQAVTVNGGMVMRAWYDITVPDLMTDIDENGILRAVAMLTSLVDEEIRLGVPAGAIVLAGFSQGGVIAAHTALRYPQALAGLVMLSTYLPLSPTLTPATAIANASMPVFIAHGEDDPIVPALEAARSREQLGRRGCTIDSRLYPMAHSTCLEEIRELGDWLKRILC